MLPPTKSDAEWNRIFREKFEDPDYYERPSGQPNRSPIHGLTGADVYGLGSGLRKPKRQRAAAARAK